ncbi:hypothetical protein [Spirosoma fluviale]|uniref:Uncharacterized protein n=1 Tax=Spirosoma fluviale TaxID=1597977 RepID=A0A286G512_9BACT|nr:hypothetical protein [Spirosoma fluviale]SOD90316.1 hypothetical protein SAMN06269250_3375 [Spirosoma fluviale]
MKAWHESHKTGEYIICLAGSLRQVSQPFSRAGVAENQLALESAKTYESWLA